MMHIKRIKRITAAPIFIILIPLLWIGYFAEMIIGELIDWCEY